MTDAPSLDGLSAPSAGSGQPPAAPSVAEKPKKPAPTPAEAAVKRWKALIPTAGGAVYLCYLLWSGLLVSILPDPSGKLQALVPIALISAGVGALALIGVGAFGVMRIAASGATINIRKRSLIILGCVIVPGILVSAAVPLFVMREPALSLDIEKPVDPEDFVAPLPVTYSVAKAIETLNTRGLKPVKYQWDIDGDGKVNEETVSPTLTVNYDRDGVYVVSARILLSNGSSRKASRRIILRSAVFTVQPAQPIIERPALFNVANLVKDPNMLKEVRWDFRGDGKPEVTKTTEIPYTFYTKGKATVSVTILLNNNTQQTYSRSVEVIDPPPLAFPAKLVTEPQNLISPAPFGVRFSVDTDELVGQIQWTFGDGEKAEGMQVAHTYDKRGNFPVTASIRSKSGSLVELNALVLVAETLNLPDLKFEGSPVIQGDKISGEVPLTINLRPRTGVPFVEFLWEAPEATEIGSTKETIQAIYRRDGLYNLTLIAQDAEDHVYRKVYSVEVKPRTTEVLFVMRPESGVAPLPVAFDASESFVPGEEITGYEWGFGDRTPRITGSARAEHTYDEAGTYVVNLVLRTVSGKEYQANKTIVVRPSELASCIKASRTTLKPGGGVRFDGSCSQGRWDTMTWEFGDGSQTTESEPVHVFAEPGVYTVKLTLFEKATLREATTSVTITVAE